jgi:hypothetical protein
LGFFPLPTEGKKPKPSPGLGTESQKIGEKSPGRSVPFRVVPLFVPNAERMPEQRFPARITLVSPALP